MSQLLAARTELALSEQVDAGLERVHGSPAIVVHLTPAGWLQGNRGRTVDGHRKSCRCRSTVFISDKKRLSVTVGCVVLGALTSAALKPNLELACGSVSQSNWTPSGRLSQSVCSLMYLGGGRVWDKLSSAVRLLTRLFVERHHRGTVGIESPHNDSLCTYV